MNTNGTSALNIEQVESKEPELETEVKSLIAVASEIVVDDQDSLEYAQEQVIALDGLKKKVVAWWENLKKPAHDHWKQIVEREKSMLAPIQSRRDTLARSISTYLTEQERIRREEQRKAEEEAERIAAEERARLAKEAEAAIESGDDQAAEMLIEEAEMVEAAPVVLAPTVEKTVKTSTGTMSQKNEVEVTVVDLLALCKEIAEGRAPVTLIKAQDGKIKSWVKLQGHTKFPGLSITEKVAASFRGKR